MIMKVFSVFLLLLILVSCEEEQVNNYKDLEQNMMDLKIYQENLGDQVKAKNLQDASWFLEGIDSILQILNKKFKEHHKMKDPFSYHYKREMKEPVSELRSAIKKNDTAKALQSYRLLVKNCNSCHIDHEIDKEVKF
jgi:hypothetical protein